MDINEVLAHEFAILFGQIIIDRDDDVDRVIEFEEIDEVWTSIIRECFDNEIRITEVAFDNGYWYHRVYDPSWSDGSESKVTRMELCDPNSADRLLEVVKYYLMDDD